MNRSKSLPAELLEITGMLTLSTWHISPRTARDWMPGCPWPSYDKGDYGWFMHVPGDAAITEAEGVPLEIRSVTHLARRERCQWIMWDRDGPVLDQLPRYDW